MNYDPYPWYAEQTRERFVLCGEEMFVEYELDLTARDGFQFAIIPN